MKPLRIGIVGAGRHGIRYARHAARDLDEIELVTICRRDQEQGRAAADELGCDFTSEAAELIADPRVEAVVFVTVPDLLPDFIRQAVAQRKALLVEKPVAPNLASGQALLEILRGTDSHCMVGHTLRFNSVCLALRAALPSLGRIDSLTFSQRFPPQTQLDWIDDPKRAGGGNILHTGVHCFDLMRFLTGMEPDTIACRTRSVCTRETEDNFAATITLAESDTLVQVACSRSSGGRNGLIDVSGEHGQLVGDHVLGTLYRVDSEGSHPLEVPAPRMTTSAALAVFARGIRENARPSPDYRDGLLAVAVAEAAYRAAASGGFEQIARIA